MLPSLAEELKQSVRPKPRFERFVTEAPLILGDA
jgi:hypothetical protein